MCPVCNSHPENHLHMLFLCPFALSIWGKSLSIVTILSIHPSAINSVKSILLGLFKPSITSVLKETASIRFTLIAFILWEIWKSRNRKVHDNTNRNSSYTVHSSESLAAEFLLARKIPTFQHHQVSSTTVKFPKYPESIKWRSPQVNWWKINTDGASRGNPGAAGAGAIIRDYEGKCKIVMAAPIGYTSSLSAETWALYLAITHITPREIDNIWIESDSTQLVGFINRDTSPPPYLQGMILDIQANIGKFNSCRVTHIHRQGNQAADLLANTAVDLLEAYGVEASLLIWKDVCPDFLKNVVI
ncbi:Ribonuclease H domain [Macleaya cordata]|uniref:Ribonuclease H domain n=1 Tax=Macleaya cordata TaxID=56857 RepID=A0A200QAF7_MACCD|nr:Ribonuclease H domain [Macleaya cordata]